MRTRTEREQAAEAIFNDALHARHQGDLEKAVSLCERALSKLAADDHRLLAMVHGEMGYVLRLRRDYPASESHYALSVQHAPRSELASLGLFHSIVDQGDWERGMAEVVRFLEVQDSPEYRELLTSLLDDDLPSTAQPLAKKARALLAAHDVAPRP